MIINSVFKIYNINRALVKIGDRVEIILIDKRDNLSLSRWINFINSLKEVYRKEVDFFSYKDALSIYGNLDSFTLVDGDRYE